MKVTVFDSYDKERLNPVELDLKEVKKDASFTMNDVTYVVQKVFKKRGIKGKCVELKMIAYKIANTTTTFAHKCMAKKGQMQKIKPETKDLLIQKYGKHTVDAWEQGRNKMKFGSLTSICPDCGVVFYKDKVELPEKIEVTSTRGKKQLKKRK